MSYSYLSVRITFIFSSGKMADSGTDTILFAAVVLYTGNEAQRVKSEVNDAKLTVYMQNVQESFMNFLRLVMLETISHSYLEEIINWFIRRRIGTWVKDQGRIRIACCHVFPVQLYGYIANR